MVQLLTRQKQDSSAAAEDPALADTFMMARWDSAGVHYECIFSDGRGAEHCRVHLRFLWSVG